MEKKKGVTLEKANKIDEMILSWLDLPTVKIALVVTHIDIVGKDDFHVPFPNMNRIVNG